MKYLYFGTERHPRSRCAESPPSAAPAHQARRPASRAAAERLPIGARGEDVGGKEEDPK